MAAWRVGFAVGPGRTRSSRWRATFAWQALAIDGVAQAAALAALTGPQGWIEAARAELAEMRPRAIDAANATGILRAELPEAAAFVWAAIDGDEDEWSDRLAARARDHRAPGPPLRRGDAAPADPVRRPARGARGAARARWRALA